MNETVVVRFTLNGQDIKVTAPPLQRLLDVLRNTLGLIGTKEGCGEGDCGACTVLIDGLAVVSCLVPIVQVEGANVRTIEGLANGLELHPLQEAFLKLGGTQCGMCAPGFLMTAQAHLDGDGETTEAAIREALSGVLCRCTGYNRVIDSVRHASGGEAHDDPGHL